MLDQEPAVITGRRRRDLRVAVIAVCVLVAAAAVTVVSRTTQPVHVAAVQAVDARAGGAAAPPVAQISSASVAQGGAFSVSLKADKIAAASVSFNGRDYPMIESDGVWHSVIGAGQRIGSQAVLAAGTYPVTVRYQRAGARKVSSESLEVTVAPVDFPTDRLTLTNAQMGLVTPEVEQSEAARLSQAYGGFTPEQLWRGPFELPVQGRVTTVFGDHVAYNGGPPIDSHPGVDIAVPLGTPAHASAAGTVSWTGQLPDHGNGVIIDHGLGVFTGYFHLSQIDARIGQRVQEGEPIGLVGSSGLSTGPHLHWEVAVGGVNVDGLQFLEQTLP